jgi:2-keto-4-pentenoate hydratase/2-oxohepta-3-ene-1,7-dioic acid hydratase in catechol pathway
MSALKLASFITDGNVHVGAVKGSGLVDLSKRSGGRYRNMIDLIKNAPGSLAEARVLAEAKPDYALADVHFLPPVPHPEKIVCVGINYPERNEEYRDGRKANPYPNLFVRFPDSVVGHNQPMIKTKESEKFDYEGEIVLVIGKTCRQVPRDKAMSVVFGTTLGNEGSVRDWLRHGTLNVTQGKNFDHSGSVGPWIVPSDDLNPFGHLHLMTRVNGELRQDDNTARLTWDFAWLIEYITKFATLKPGDMLFTGTPTGAGGHQTPPQWLRAGDVVEVEVPEIGVLKNTVVDEK